MKLIKKENKELSISINVQPGLNGTLLATSYSFDDAKEPFVTFDVTVPGSGHVAVFLRNTDDARRLVDAAVEAYRKCEAQDLERRISTVVGELPVFGGNTVTEESYNKWIASGDNGTDED